MQCMQNVICDMMPTMQLQSVFAVYSQTSPVCLSDISLLSADLMGFIGALGTGPTTFWYPSVIWLVLKKPGMGSMHFWACWVCIVLGVLVTVLGSIGGLRGIIVDAQTFSVYP